MRLARPLLLIALLCLPALASAQAPQPPRREGSAEFAFVGTTGNASTQSIGLGGELIDRPAPWESKFKINYVRNDSDGQLKAEALVATLRAARPARTWVAGYVEYGYQHDRFAGILGRHVAEGGISLTPLDEPRQSLVVDSSAGYTRETRPLGEHLATAIGNAGGVYTLKISATSTLTEDLHAVLSLSDSRNWRLANALALTAKVSEIFSLKASNTVRYLNLPAPGFKHADSVTAMALVAKF